MQANILELYTEIALHPNQHHRVYPCDHLLPRSINQLQVEEELWISFFSFRWRYFWKTQIEIDYKEFIKCLRHFRKRGWAGGSIWWRWIVWRISREPSSRIINWWIFILYQNYCGIWFDSILSCLYSHMIWYTVFGIWNMAYTIYDITYSYIIYVYDIRYIINFYMTGWLMEHWNWSNSWTSTVKSSSPGVPSRQHLKENHFFSIVHCSEESFNVLSGRIILRECRDSAVTSDLL